MSIIRRKPETPAGFAEAIESEAFKQRLQLIADRLTITFQHEQKHNLNFYDFCLQVPEYKHNVLYWYGYLRCLYFLDCVGRSKDKRHSQHHMGLKKMIAMWWGGDSFSLDGAGGRKTEYVSQWQVDLAVKNFAPMRCIKPAYTFARKVSVRSFGFEAPYQFGNYSDEHYSPSVIPTLPEPYQKIMFPKRH